MHARVFDALYQVRFVMLDGVVFCAGKPSTFKKCLDKILSCLFILDRLCPAGTHSSRGALNIDLIQVECVVNALDNARNVPLNFGIAMQVLDYEHDFAAACIMCFGDLAERNRDRR